MSGEHEPFEPSPFAVPTISFGVLLNALWKGRKVVAVCAALCLALGILSLFVLKPRYTSVMMITPKYSDKAGVGGLSSYISMLGSGAEDPNFTLFKESIGSIRLAKEIQDRYNLLQQVFPDQWDDATHQWKRPSGSMVPLKNALKAVLHRPEWSPPDERDLAQFLSQSVVLTRGGKLGDEQNVYRLSYTSSNPQDAAKVLNMVYWGAEAVVREQQRYDLTRRVTHLQDMVAVEPSQDVRAELIRRILSDQTQLALLQNNQPAATMVLDPPYVPKVQSFPNPMLTIMFSIVMGLLLGLCLGAVHGMFDLWVIVGPVWKGVKGMGSSLLLRRRQSDEA